MLMVLIQLNQFSDLTDLDIYYSKLTNAFNRASNREIDQKYPSSPAAFHHKDQNLR